LRRGRQADMKNMKRPGFSLIETLLAAAIVFVLILAIGELLLGAARARTRGDAASAAADVLAAKLEELKSLPFDSPDLGPGIHEDEATAPSGAPFVRRWTAEDAGLGLKLVNVEIFGPGETARRTGLPLYFSRDLGF
jgi:type II secretory pathway pseudopilin PulG